MVVRHAYLRYSIPESKLGVINVGIAPTIRINARWSLMTFICGEGEALVASTNAGDLKNVGIDVRAPETGYLPVHHCERARSRFSLIITKARYDEEAKMAASDASKRSYQRS
ncbi:hypothetical protein PM082_024189 [Marasmius tenuissimus]|nr:hypothetical protein PM082_024189 [Marasmius tenuissimus]